jgi:septal ring factor EnvC (AmiA/AmiB activator)
MKNKVILLMALMVPLCAAVWAQDKAPAVDANAAFPTDAVVTPLTEAQEKEAGKLLDEARGIYDFILNDDDEGKADYLQSNLAFIRERIDTTSKELAQKQADLNALNQKVLDRQKQIDALQISDGEKGRKRVELVDEFRNEKESLTFRITILQKHLSQLQSKQSVMDSDLKGLGEAATPAPTPDQKALQELQKVREEEQQKRFNKYNR